MAATPIPKHAVPQLSAALALALLSSHPSLRAPSQAQQSTKQQTLDPTTTTKELGTGAGGPLGTEGSRRRSDEELQNDVDLERVERDALVGQYNAAVEELAAIKPQKQPQQTRDVRLALLRQEEALLVAELNAAREANLPPPAPKTRQADPTEASLATLARTIAELKLARERAESELKREQQLLTRDDLLLADAMALNEALHEQLTKQREEVQPGADQLVARAQARANRVTAAFGSLMSTLVAFIDDRLAAVGENEEIARMDEDESGDESESGDSSADEEERKDRKRRKAAKRRRGQKLSLEGATSIQAYFAAPPTGEEDEEMVPDEEEAPTRLPRTAAEKGMALKQLLENLMNTAVASTSGPSSWLTVRAPPAASARTIAQFPPPELVDFLLRAGVVRERAGDQSKVRLVEFGKQLL